MKRTLAKILLPPLLSTLLVFSVFALKGHTRFDESLYDFEQVKTHLNVLTSPELKGRGLAEEGQALTESYLEQFFKTNQLDYTVVPSQVLVPVWNKNTQFQVGDTALTLFKDFEPTADYYGSSIDFNGDILYVGRDFTQIDPALMKGRLVCFYANRLTDAQIEAARAAGAKGLLYHITYGGFDGGQSRVLRNHKTLDMSHKKGTDFFMAEISNDVLRQLRNIAKTNYIEPYTQLTQVSTTNSFEERLVGYVPNVKLHAVLDYKIADCKNYIVTIKGKNSTHATNWITHYDGLGLSPDQHTYYPSAIEGGVSTSLLLEMARTAKLQRTTPVQDINFIFLSGLSVNDSSAVKTSEFLKTRASYQANWLVESVCYAKSSNYQITWNAYNDLDRMLISQVQSNMSLFPSIGFSSGEGTYTHFDRYETFKNIDSATITLTDSLGSGAYELLGSPNDTSGLYNEAAARNLVNLFLGHFDRQLYAEKSYDFIQTSHLWLIWGLLMFIHLIALPEKWTAAKTAPSLIVTLSEQVPYKLLRRGILGLLPFILSIFVVNLILSVPANVNLKTVGATYVTNFSFYDTFMYSYMGFIAFLSTLISPDPALYKEISLYLSRSLILIGWGLGLAIGLGLVKGLLDAYFQKNNTGFSTLSSIVLYSIPDVLIAFLSLVSVVYLSKVDWVTRVVDPNTLRLYVMPILSLTIVPIIYISRLVFVALEEEKKKDYVKFLLYKGLNKRQIYLKHFSKVGLIKILDSAKAIVMLIFSNLIVVEYLFNYPGIMYNLIGSSGEPIKVIILSLSIGLSFVSIYLLSVLALNLIHPGRRIR